MDIRAVILGVAGRVVFTVLPAISSEVDYNPEDRTVRVRSFPKESPCTPDAVFNADRREGWRVMTYSGDTDTFTLNGSLVIGDSDGTETYFRIGSEKHPKVTLVLTGNLVLHEPRRERYTIYLHQNGLTAGNAAKPEIQPRILFDCSRDDQFGFSAGGGNLLHVHNARFSALTSDGKHDFFFSVDHRISSRGDMILKDSEFSHFTSARIPGWDSRISHCVFEHGHELYGCGLYAENCVFRNVSFVDHGAAYEGLLRCRLGENVGIYLKYATGMMATDCFFADTAKQPEVQFWKNPQTGTMHYPSFIALRHLVVRAVAGDGEPVPDARVTLACDQNDLSAVHHGFARTGEDGRTPGIRQSKALFVTDWYRRVNPKTEQAETKEFTYTVTVMADGFEPARLTGMNPDQSWELKEVVLERQSHPTP